MTTADLFRKTRRSRRQAEVYVDRELVGIVAGEGDLTPAMRAHGVTMIDLKGILSGRQRVRTFRCNGMVRIVGVDAVPSLASILAA